MLAKRFEPLTSHIVQKELTTVDLIFLVIEVFNIYIYSHKYRNFTLYIWCNFYRGGLGEPPGLPVGPL